jgi:hypothetical protein
LTPDIPSQVHVCTHACGIQSAAAAAMERLAAGSAAEVCGLASEGFAGAYFAATLAAPVCAADTHAAVIFAGFYGGGRGGTPSVERVALARVRPCPPRREGALREGAEASPDNGAEEASAAATAAAAANATPLHALYPAGAHVDVWMLEAWWQGVVQERVGDGIRVRHPGASRACRGSRRRIDNTRTRRSKRALRTRAAHAPHTRAARRERHGVCVARRVALRDTRLHTRAHRR